MEEDVVEDEVEEEEALEGAAQKVKPWSEELAR